MIDLICFDFDGVIVDSVPLKGDAFEHIYRDEGPAFMDRVRTHHLANGGMSRFEKFKIYNQWLNRPTSEEVITKLAAHYAELVREAVIEAKLMAGWESFMDVHSSVPSYVVSATPEDELSFIVDAKHLTRRFVRVCGSPTSKSTHLEHILAETETPASRALMIGDAIHDRDAARTCGMHFALKVNANNRELIQTLRDSETAFESFDDLTLPTV